MSKIKIKVEPTSDPNLRKLARALIALAQYQLDEETAAQADRPAPKAVRTPTGSAA